MAPYFIRNLIPRREARAEGRPLLEALSTITLVQWGLFWTGYVNHSPPLLGASLPSAPVPAPSIDANTAPPAWLACLLACGSTTSLDG